MELEQGDVVLCTVERIEKTIVFVDVEGIGGGSIVTSEIAAGRIRNLRDYVVPKKKIVCKVLRISPSGNIELSLRRVSQKEKKEVLEKHSQEKGYISILKTILKDKAEETIQEITKQDSVYSFLQEAKKNPAELENIVGKKDSEKILEILNTQKKKTASIKKEFHLTTAESDGIESIKKILCEIKNAEIKYISAGKYSIKIEAEELKIADNKLKDILDNLEKQAKKYKLDFSIKEK